MRTNYRAMNDTIVERNDMAAYIERIRVALGGYKDSDLADLATTLKTRNDALEAEIERLRLLADEALEYVSQLHYDAGTEDYMDTYGKALVAIATPIDNTTKENQS